MPKFPTRRRASFRGRSSTEKWGKKKDHPFGMVFDELLNLTYLSLLPK